MAESKSDEKNVPEKAVKFDLSKINSMEELANFANGKKLSSEQIKAVNMKAFELGTQGK
jgi:hypothetical protein